MPYTQEIYAHDTAFATALLELVDSIIGNCGGYRLHNIRIEDWPRAYFDSWSVVIWYYRRVLDYANHEIPNSLSPAAHQAARMAEAQIYRARFYRPEIEEMVENTLDLLDHVRGDFMVVAARARDFLLFQVGDVEELTQRAVEYECHAASMMDWMKQIREVSSLDPIEEAKGLEGDDCYDGSESEYSQDGVINHMEELLLSDEEDDFEEEHTEELFLGEDHVDSAIFGVGNLEDEDNGNRSVT